MSPDLLAVRIAGRGDLTCEMIIKRRNVVSIREDDGGTIIAMTDGPPVTAATPSFENIKAWFTAGKEVA